MSFRRKFLVAVTALFFASMFVLSQTAETAHNGALPHVRLTRPQTYMFPFEYELESGETVTGSAEKTAVTADMLESGIFTVYQAEKNGTMRYYARRLNIVTGSECDGFIEVISGIGYTDRLVCDSSELHGGCEVVIEK